MNHNVRGNKPWSYYTILLFKFKKNDKKLKRKKNVFFIFYSNFPKVHYVSSKQSFDFPHTLFCFHAKWRIKNSIIKLNNLSVTTQNLRMEL